MTKFKILNSLPFLLTVLILIFSRLYLLSSLPVAISHDETVYAIQAKSFAVQAVDTTQKIKPFSMTLVHAMYAEWPASLMAPFFKLTSNPILATHLMTALMGILLPLGFAYLVYGLWSKKDLALVALLVATFNPLLWQFGRLSFDAIFSVFFYVWAAALLINLKSLKKLWSIPLFILGFFEYQGMKLLLVPFVGSLLLLDFFSLKFSTNWKKNFQQIKNYAKKPISLVFYFSLALTIVYALVILPNQNTAGRLSKTIISDNNFLSQEVNTSRRLSLPTNLNTVFANKLTQSQLFVIKNLFAAFSPFLLFIQGEPAASGFAVWSHGVFYLVDFIFLLIGIVTIFHHQKLRKQGLILVLMPIVFSLPSLINTMSEWYLLREMLAYVSLLLIVSWGIWQVCQFKYLKWLVIAIYLISVINFAYQFYFRYPVYSADSNKIQERIISRYVQLMKETGSDHQIIVYTSEPERLFASYLLYANQLTGQTKNQVALAYNQQRYQLNNVLFTNECADLTKSEVLIVQTLHSKCKDDLLSVQEKNQNLIKENQALSIPAVLDSGETFRIYNDILCQSSPMKPFFAVDNFKDFQMERLSKDDFCYHFITDLRSFAKTQATTVEE